MSNDARMRLPAFDALYDKSRAAAARPGAHEALRRDERHDLRLRAVDPRRAIRTRTTSRSRGSRDTSSTRSCSTNGATTTSSRVRTDCASVMLPTGTVTFLFSDIEGSTALLRAIGVERYESALQQHRRLLRDAFARHAGHEFGTEGDALFVAFARAVDAVRAAADAQRALASARVGRRRAHPRPHRASTRARRRSRARTMSASASIARPGSARPGTAARSCCRRRRATSWRTIRT